MPIYEVEMQHDESSFIALSHMQYDLFCRGNRFARTLLSIALIVLGILYHQNWWGYLLIAYGCYLSTSTYSSPNRTARKLSEQITQSAMPFPCSKLVFQQNVMEIVPLPEDGTDMATLTYTDIARLGEDFNYYYIFRDHYGGYMVPKSALGDKTKKFRAFLEQKTNQTFYARTTPLMRLLARIRRLKSEPYHL